MKKKIVLIGAAAVLTGSLYLSSRAVDFSAQRSGILADLTSVQDVLGSKRDEPKPFELSYQSRQWHIGLDIPSDTPIL
ncbi:MAG: hypothetical protein HUJ54_12340 [Erysipelotrichaceae bacterium]|nr:hypothetical protein [Erysipelotrichaceae bacterium]